MTGDPGDDGKPRNASEVWDRLQALPSMQDDPLVWDHRAGGFVRKSQLDAQAQAAAPARPTRPAGAPPAAPAAPVPMPVDPTMIQPRPGASAAGAPVAAGSPGRRHVVINAGDAPAAAPAPAAPRPAPAAPPPGPTPAFTPPPRAPNPPKARQAPAPAPKAPKSTGAKRRTRRRVVAVVVLLPVLFVLLGFGFAWYKFSQIPRAEVSAALSPAMATGTNYLIVGTDSREGITASDPNAGAFIGSAVSGSRTDSIMVMHLEGSTQSLLSIPRDLWVKDPATGQMGRINSTFTAGAPNLIKAVQGLGIPVQHYAEINFVSFGRLVDSVGGIDITFAYPARDANSGLNIQTAGVNHLDGTAALAYVRSRHYEELKDGTWVTDPRSDLGRVERQRTFLAALMNQVTATRNPFTLSGITDAMSVGLKIDDSMTLLDALRVGWQLRGFHPTSGSLPVTPRTTSGGAEVLDLKQPDATTLIGQFNQGGLPAPPADPATGASTTVASKPPPTTARKK